jgi:hypothetical protein
MQGIVDFLIASCVVLAIGGAVSAIMWILEERNE